MPGNGNFAKERVRTVCGFLFQLIMQTKQKPKYAQKTAYTKTGGITLFTNLLVLLAVAGICITVGVAYYNCRVKQNGYDEKLEALTSQIEAEEERTREIEEYEKYTHTKQFVEEVAKDRLGLVYPGEIVFIPEDD